MVRKMSDDDVIAFLTSPVRTGHIATVRPDGRPHVATIWYTVDGRDIVFLTESSSVKARNLAQNPRAMLSVDDPELPYTAVTAEGPVAISTDEAEVKRWVLALATKYHGEEHSEEVAAGLPDDTIYRLTPTHFTGLAYIEES